MRIKSLIFSAAIAAAALSVAPTANAAPVGLAGVSGFEAPMVVEQVQYRRYYGGRRHYGYRRGYGGGAAAGVAAGVLGALAVGAIAAEASRPKPPVVNYEPACMRTRSYDPASETFVDRRGRVRSCTY